MAISAFDGQARLTQATWLLRSVASVACVAALAACQSTDAAGSDSAHAAPDSGARCPPEEDASGPAVSFVGDMMPLFAGSCALQGCHDGLAKNAGLYLGPSVIEPPATATTPSEVYASLRAQATTTPDLPRITPGDPQKSFLFLKIEDCQNQMGLSCKDTLAAGPCGQRMPALSPPLSVDKRRLVARWIAQNAVGP